MVATHYYVDYFSVFNSTEKCREQIKLSSICGDISELKGVESEIEPDFVILIADCCGIGTGF